MKYERSEKQKKATERMREQLSIAQAIKKQERAEALAKKQLEEKKRKEQIILKKAMSIRKKQLKEEAILDEISDDDTPIEEVKAMLKQKKAPVAPKIAEKMKAYEKPIPPPATPKPVPKFIFV